MIEIAAEETGSGTPLVLVHAFPLDAAMWNPVRDHLAGRARLITPHMRGFGPSPLTGDGAERPDVAHYADDLAGLLDRLGVERAVVGGVSMGGYVAMAFARRHRDRLLGLVLADTRAGADSEEAVANRLRIADTLESTSSCEVLLAEVLPNLYGQTTLHHRSHLLAVLREMVLRADPVAAAWAQRAMAARPDSTAVLAGLEVPALVLVGEEDVPSPVAEAEAIAAALPEATLVRLPAAGHLPPVETPQAFAAPLLEFVGRF